MDLTSNLTEFSLPEVFQFLEQGQKTGLLTVHPLIAGGVRAFHVWLQHGRIVAAADRLDCQGLTSLLQQRNWVSDRVVSKIPLICSLNSALGLCLKSQGILDTEQLKLLFRIQIVGTVSLQAIAQNLGLPVERIQQIAFRLIVVNLAEEIFLVSTTPASTKPLIPNIIVNDFPSEPAMVGTEAKTVNGVSKSFLHNLVGFLKGKT